MADLKDYKTLLEKYISFKTISTDSDYLSEIEKCVKWLEDVFKSRGFKVEVVRGFSNPIIIAKYMVDDDLDHALIYGHYDVQPSGDESAWKSAAFELTERATRLYARGVIDNKGQAVVHMVNVFKHIEAGTLKRNVTFLFEGGEEIGSPNIDKFLQENKSKLAADFIVISDGTLIGDNPVVEVGLRGIMNLTIEVSTSHTELHSGMFGGSAPNAALELSKVLSKLVNEEGRIQIPGMYKNVPEPTESELNNNSSIPFSIQEHEKLTGTKVNLSEPGLDFYTQTGLRPTVQITGLNSGYIGEGYKTGIPHKATAKLNVRLVGEQNAEEILVAIDKFLADNLPHYASYSILDSDVGKGSVGAVKVDIDNKYVSEAITILEQVYGKKVLKKYVGGTIPLVYFIKDILQIPQVIVPLANADSNMHAANENYDIELLVKALEFSNRFFSGGDNA